MSAGMMSNLVLVMDEDPRTLEVVGQAARDLPVSIRAARSVESAMALSRALSPAVLISAIDVDGNPSGFSLGRAVRHHWGSAVIFVERALSSRYVGTVAAFNPDGFLCKPLRPEQMEVTLRLVLKRRASGVPASDQRTSRPVSMPDIDLSRALREIAAVVNGTGVLDLKVETGGPVDRPLASLRPREQEVVRLLFEHYRVPAIATKLGISPQTVRNHLKRVFQSLGVHSQQELMARLRHAASVPPSASSSAASPHVASSL